MSLVGSYGSHLLHSFHPHLLQTLNHGMLAANGNAAAASYFASERAALGKPSVLGNFQLPSAFSPPKYIGISLDQVSRYLFILYKIKKTLSFIYEIKFNFISSFFIFVALRISLMAVIHFAPIPPVPLVHHMSLWKAQMITTPRRVKVRAVMHQIPGI